MAVAQGRTDDLDLPVSVGRLISVLKGAAAANVVMQARRRDAVGRSRDHLEQVAAQDIAGLGNFRLNRVAGQRAADKNRPARRAVHTVALRA